MASEVAVRAKVSVCCSLCRSLRLSESCVLDGSLQRVRGLQGLLSKTPTHTELRGRQERATCAEKHEWHQESGGAARVTTAMGRLGDIRPIDPQAPCSLIAS